MKDISMKIYFNEQKQVGQGMTEYIIIVALIAVAAIGVFQFFGSTVRNQAAGIAQEVAGQNGTAAISKAGTEAQKAEDKASKDTNLSNYGGQSGGAK